MVSEAQPLPLQGMLKMQVAREQTVMNLATPVVELEVQGTDGDLLLKGLRVRWGLGLRENLFVIDREKDDDGSVERLGSRSGSPRGKPVVVPDYRGLQQSEHLGQSAQVVNILDRRRSVRDEAHAAKH